MAKKQNRKFLPSQVKTFVIDSNGNLSIDFNNNKRDKFAGGQTLNNSSVRIGDSWVDLKTFISEGFWKYSNNTVESDPTSGYLKFDNVDLNLVTEFYISTTSQQGANFTILLSFLSIGTTLEVKQFSDFGKGVVFSIKSITNNGTWIKFGIYVISVEEDFEKDGIETVARLVTLPVLNDRVILTQFNIAQILSEPIDSTKEYFIDGVIDISGLNLEIEVPTTGISLKGYSFDASQLICSDDNYTMFSSNGGTSGNILLTDLAVETSGTSSQVYGLVKTTGFEAIEINRVNYNNCTSLGYIDGYRQGLELGTGRFGGTPELELRGNWIGGFRVSTTIARNIGSSILFKAGVGLVLNGRFLSDINMEGETNASLTDFSSSNIFYDGKLEIINANFSGVTNPLPNIDAKNVKSRFRNNVGIRNTYVGAQWKVTSIAVTDLTVMNPNKIAGTTTYVDEQWFSNTSDNAFTYDSDQEIEVEVKGTLSLTGTSNNQVSLEVRLWDDSASSYVILSKTGAITINTGGRAEGISILGYSVVNQNDRIEIWVENQTGNINVTAELNGLVGVSERQS